MITFFPHQEKAIEQLRSGSILCGGVGSGKSRTSLGYFLIKECNGDLDHIHLLIDCSPQHYIPNIIKALKGVSARLLFKQYGDTLKKQLYGGHLWSPSYFVSTVSENTEAQIRLYIQKQKIK